MVMTFEAALRPSGISTDQALRAKSDSLKLRACVIKRSIRCRYGRKQDA